jgi:peptidoglycan hydrolase CwlO-like protein
MSLDGLRAWIGMVERKLLMRTRVFLALVAIAIGGSAAAIYLAVDAQDNSVSQADVETVRDELEVRIAEQSGETDVTQLEAELETLQSEITALRAEEASGAGKNATK